MRINLNFGRTSSQNCSFAYLPTTIKLVKVYCELDENAMDSEKILKLFSSLKKKDSEIIILLRKLLNMIHYGERESAD